MPGFNGMGPVNNGPMTGRGFGKCSTENLEGNLGFGMGRRMKNGRRGASGNFNLSAGINNSPDTTLKNLKSQRDFLEKRINDLEKEINGEKQEV